MKGFINDIRKRTIALLLVLVFSVSFIPNVLHSAKATDIHTHTFEECCRLVCDLEEGEQITLHIHSSECSSSDAECGLTEGKNLIGTHTHSLSCYELVCPYADSSFDTEGKESDSDSTAAPSAAHSGSDSDDTNKSDHSRTSDSDKTDEPALPMIPMFSPPPAPYALTDLSISGVWDYGSGSENENISFGSSETATIDHDKNFESEKINVRVSAKFPEGATNKKLTITLAPGLVWQHNGSSSIPPSSLDSISELTNQSTVYGAKLGDGSYTYNFTDGVRSVDIDLIVTKSIATNFEYINDAITVDASCVDGGTTVSDQKILKTVKPTQNNTGFVSASKLSAFVKPDETVYIVGSPLVMHTYTNDTAVYHFRLYDYVEFKITAPSNVNLVSVANAHPGSSISTAANSKWQIKSQETVGDSTVYTIRLENQYYRSFGVTPEIMIPSSEYAPDDKVTLTVGGIEWKFYGDDVIHSTDKTGTLTYTVVDPNKRNEVVILTPYSHTMIYTDDSPDAVYQLTGWHLKNDGTDPSLPKVVEFEFDTTKIGVTNVTLLIPKGETLTKVWYKLKGDTQWTEKAVNLKATGSSSFTSTILSNVDLGLSENDYFSAMKYELDFVDKNGTPDDTSDDISYGIPAGATSTGKSGVYTPIAGFNTLQTKSGSVTSYVRVYDKVEEGREIVNDTGKTALKTNFSSNYYNFIQYDNKEKKTASAGTTMNFSSTFKSYWAGSTGFAYCVGFMQYPVIYIRDETGSGITNVQLISSDGYDVLKKYSEYVKVEYSHTETDDHNGDGKFAKVYKIDTTPLSSLPDKADRFGAAIGCYDISEKIRTLTLKYSITTPSTYSDSQTIHNMYDAIFLENGSLTSSTTTRNKLMVASDSFDVNNDGKTTGSDILTGIPSNVTGYYLITSRADISVATAAKKASDSVYDTWNGSAADYIQMEPDEDYNLRISIFNGSGFPTSTEIDMITYIYVPIPKQGQEWGKLNSGTDSDGKSVSAFTYSTKFTAPIVNPDSSVFTIEYGNVDTSSFTASSDIAAVGAKIRNGTTSWGAYSADANCVRIAISGMPASEAPVNFTFPLEAVETTAENDETNIFSAVYFEDITDDQGRRYTGWFNSDNMALQIAWGSISGRVWIDSNGNGIQDSGEVGMENVAVDAVYSDDAARATYSLSTTTDADGKYSFSNLGSDEYMLIFRDSRFKSYVCSPINKGTSDSLDSDGTIHSSSNDEMLSAQITYFDIPFTDSMGSTSYDAVHMDLGIVPIVSVSHQWKGDVPSSVSSAVPETEAFAAGTKYTAPTVSTTAGYTFGGWYTDESCIAPYTDGTAVTEDTTLYGKWIINQYDITYFWDDAPAGAVLPTKDTVDYNTSYSAKSPAAVTGYTFDKWYTDESCTVPYTDGTAVTKDTTLYGKWSINSYDVTYSWDNAPTGALLPTKDTVDYNTSYNAKTPDAVTGYTFDKWYTDENCTVPYTDGSAVTDDTILYGKWIINRYDVTYLWDNAPTGAVLPTKDTVDYNTSYNAKAPAAVTGYTFDKWYTDESCTVPYTNGTAVTEDTTLYGKWSINSYDVTYSWDNAPTGAVLPTKDTVDYNTSYNAKTPDAVTGYTFDKWYTDENCTVPYTDGTAVTDDTILYGKWIINQYDVTYLWDNAPAGAVLPTKDTVDYNTSYSAKTPAAVTGYTFDKWYTDENCTVPYTDGTVITEDTTLYGKWTRNLISVSGKKIWVENGEGFVRPDNVIIELYRNSVKLDSVSIAKDTSASEQSFSFDGLYECDEQGNKYTYSVKESVTPENYVSVTSGYDIINTYNVDKYVITKVWDHTGAPEAERPENSLIRLYRDDSIYRTLTMNGTYGLTQTVIVPRLQSGGHSFRIEEDSVPGYTTTYDTPIAEDTDSDGAADTVYYTVRNSYDMPKIKVSGIKTWIDVPKGETVPDITVDLMVGSSILSSCDIASGESTFEFTDLDRYNPDGTVRAYTVSEQAVENYSPVYTVSETDADGNISINIENKGTFTYGTLTVSNTVTGEDVPEGDEFAFTVYFSSSVEYEYTGSHSGTVRSGDTVFLKDGESITISDILAGVIYRVEQTENPAYITEPAGRVITNTVASDEKADFVNNYITPPNGNLEITSKVSGKGADKNLYFEYTVEFDSDKSFKYKIGDTYGVISNGDIIKLRHGETATIFKLPEGISYKVTQTKKTGYVLSSKGDSGFITTTENSAVFTNRKTQVAGDYDAPGTGDDSTAPIIATIIMQIGLLTMLFCIWQFRRRKQN